MVIWQGLGYLVAVIVFAVSLAANLVTDAIFGEAYYDQHNWPFAASLACSAVACWVLGMFLRRRRERALLEGGAPRRDALFFIPLRWWPPILLVAAVVLGASGLVG